MRFVFSLVQMQPLAMLQLDMLHNTPNPARQMQRAGRMM